MVAPVTVPIVAAAGLALPGSNWPAAAWLLPTAGLICAALALTALAVYAIIRSNPARRAPPMAPLPPYAPQAPATAPARHWSDAGRFQVELQIESQFQPVLR